MDRQQTIDLYKTISLNAKRTTALFESILRQNLAVEFACEVLDSYDLYLLFAKTSDYGLKTLGEKPCKLQNKEVLSAKWHVMKNTMFGIDVKKISLLVIRSFEKNEYILDNYKDAYINAGKQAKKLCELLLDTQQDERKAYVRYLN